MLQWRNVTIGIGNEKNDIFNNSEQITVNNIDKGQFLCLLSEKDNDTVDLKKKTIIYNCSYCKKSISSTVLDFDIFFCDQHCYDQHMIRYEK